METLYFRAREAAKRAVASGKLVKPDCCDACGKPVRVDLLAATHADPSKALEVVWMCRPCNNKLRRERLGIVRDSKLCLNCSKVIPHENKSDSDYLARNYCSQDCYHAHRSQVAIGKYEHDPCLNCGGEVLYISGEGKTSYQRRKYCCKACSREGSRKARAEKRQALIDAILVDKRCKGCGGEIVPHKGESPRDLEARVYCSRDCPGYLELRREVLARTNTHKGERRSGKRHESKPRKPVIPPPVRERTAEFSGFPDPRKPKLQSEPVRMTPLFEVKYCEKHPSERLNAYGTCAACVTGERWAAREREVTARPSTEGGR